MQGLQQSNHCQILHSPPAESTLDTFTQRGEEQGRFKPARVEAEGKTGLWTEASPEESRSPQPPCHNSELDMDKLCIKVNLLFWGPSHPHLGLISKAEWCCTLLSSCLHAHQKLEVGTFCTFATSAALDIFKYQLLVQGPGLMLAPQSLAEEWTWCPTQLG